MGCVRQVNEKWRDSGEDGEEAARNPGHAGPKGKLHTDLF